MVGAKVNSIPNERRHETLRRLFTLALAMGLSFSSPLGACAQEASLTAEEERERVMSERFLQVLLRRPNQGLPSIAFSPITSVRGRSVNSSIS